MMKTLFDLVKQYRTPIKDFVLNRNSAGLVEDSEDYENTALRVARRNRLWGKSI